MSAQGRVPMRSLLRRIDSAREESSEAWQALKPDLRDAGKVRHYVRRVRRCWTLCEAVRAEACQIPLVLEQDYTRPILLPEISASCANPATPTI